MQLSFQHSLIVAGIALVTLSILIREADMTVSCAHNHLTRGLRLMSKSLASKARFLRDGLAALRSPHLEDDRKWLTSTIV